MRLLAFVLSLAFGGLQTVALTDCCCAPADRPVPEKAACTGCTGATEPAPKDDCCGAPERPAPAETRGCVHVQPSQEVVAHAHDVPLAPEAVLVLAVVEAPPALGVDTPPRPWDDALHRPERGRPLYLLDSTFLI